MAYSCVYACASDTQIKCIYTSINDRIYSFPLIVHSHAVIDVCSAFDFDSFRIYLWFRFRCPSYIEITYRERCMARTVQPSAWKQGWLAFRPSVDRRVLYLLYYRMLIENLSTPNRFKNSQRIPCSTHLLIACISHCRICKQSIHPRPYMHCNSLTFIEKEWILTEYSARTLAPHPYQSYIKTIWLYDYGRCTQKKSLNLHLLAIHYPKTFPSRQVTYDFWVHLAAPFCSYAVL